MRIIKMREQELEYARMLRERSDVFGPHEKPWICAWASSGGALDVEYVPLCVDAPAWCHFRALRPCGVYCLAPHDRLYEACTGVVAVVLKAPAVFSSADSSPNRETPAVYHPGKPVIGKSVLVAGNLHLDYPCCE